MYINLKSIHQRRRLREFWKKLRKPQTIRAIITVALIIYRIIQWVIELIKPNG